MAKAPAFQWYPKECDTDENVRLMDDAQFGFYMRCLNHTWLNDGLPESLDDIARIMGRPVSKVKGYWERVGKCFLLIDGRWRNKKQEDQRQSAREFQDSRRAAANKRWDAVQVQCIPDARALHVECSASATASATAIQEEKTPTESKRTSPKDGSVAAHGSRFSLTEIPEEYKAYAVGKMGWTEDRALDVFESFRLHFTAQSGQKARMANWLAAWQGWCRRERNRPGPMLFPVRESATEKAIRIGHERMLTTGRL